MPAPAGDPTPSEEPAEPPENPGPNPDPEPDPAVSDQAADILEANCRPCHNPQNPQGGFGVVDDTAAMIRSGRYIVPGAADKSLLIQKLAPTGNMPPGGQLTPAEIATLEAWINGFSKDTGMTLADEAVLSAILQDLDQNVPPGQRAATRYLTLHIMKNAGSSQDDLEVLRLALDKVANSLSRSPVITRSVPIDEGRLIYRLSLEEIGVPTEVFERTILDFYPFGQSFIETAGDPLARQNAEMHAVLADAMRTPVYLLRADWFVATAVLPAPYARFMQFAANRTALDERLGVDILTNVQASKVVRSGFRNSGVSSSNRVIERHTQANGLAYWISYDFTSSDAERSIFANPLGPVLAAAPEPKSFIHDGGEIIFQLPNGLFGFYLADAAGKAIDKGPTNIVSHAEAPPQFASAIVNGVSCFDCHAIGLIDKKDEIRSFVQANLADFTPQQLARVIQLYVKQAHFTRSIDRDNDVYRAALEELQIDETKPEPINLVYRIYNRSLSRAQAAAELGIPPATMDELLAKEPFKTAWISLTNDGPISREAFNVLYGQALRESKPTVTGREPEVGDYLVTPTCMVASQLSMESCLVRRSAGAPPPAPEPTPAPAPAPRVPSPVSPAPEPVRPAGR